MPMQPDDIEVGIVDSFSCQKIKENMPPIKRLSRVNSAGEEIQAGNLPDDSRPFVCVGHCGDISQWAEITATNENGEHLLIECRWRTWQDGNDSHNCNVRWKTEAQYINGDVFECNDSVWGQLATNHNTQGHFKIITEDGLKHVREYLVPRQKNTTPLFPWTPTTP